MLCPSCQSPESEVKDSRADADDNCIRRWRVCRSCGLRFRTHETAANGSRVTMKQIFWDAAKRHGVTHEEICGRGRTKATTKARDEIAYRMRRELGKSYSEIGRRLNRHHTTIHYAIRRYQEGA